MDFDSIRPVISGLIGGAVAVWLGYKWKRFLPAAGRPSTQAHLTHTYARTTRCANWLFGLGIGCGLFMYWSGQAASNDWRPLGLGIGGSMFGIVLLMGAAPLVVRGGTWSDAFRAYALAQKCPVVVLLPLVLAMACLFPWTIYQLYA